MSGVLASETSIVRADQVAKLETIATSGACEQQRVVTIDFAAVRARFGAQWEAKRETTTAKIESILERHTGSRAIRLPLTDSEYLVCFAEERGSAAHAVCFRVLEEALTFFLGEVRPGDLLVNAVSLIEGEAVSRAPITPDQCAATPLRPTIPVAETKPLASLTGPVMLDPGDSLRMTMELEVAVKLETEEPVGFRLAPKLICGRSGARLTNNQRATLSTRSLAEVDRQVLRALPSVLDEPDGKIAIAPLSLHAFAAGHSRLTLLAELHRLTEFERRRLVIEITGFEPGTPPSRVEAAAAVVRPFCRSVVLQANVRRDRLVDPSLSKLPVVSVGAGDVGGEGSKLAASLLAIGSATRNPATRLVVTGLPSEAFVSVSKVAGFTLATVNRPLSAQAA